jgi:hypothetical protein
MKTWRIVQHIYESAEAEPTLSHVFYGETLERAQQVFDAHMQTDAFMRSCVITNRFRNFTCHTDSSTERYDAARGAWVRVALLIPSRMSGR